MGPAYTPQSTQEFTCCVEYGRNELLRVPFHHAARQQGMEVIKRQTTKKKATTFFTHTPPSTRFGEPRCNQAERGIGKRKSASIETPIANQGGTTLFLAGRDFEEVARFCALRGSLADDRGELKAAERSVGVGRGVHLNTLSALLP